MGTWDESAFGNDTACDWAYGLERVNDLSLINATLDLVLSNGSEYLDADIACEGIAACEVVARLLGNWGKRTSYTESADKWVEMNAILANLAPSDKAIAVIERILQDPSELKELWDEGGENLNWRATMDDLQIRLNVT